MTRVITIVCDSLGVGELRAKFLSFVQFGEARAARLMVHEHLR